MMSGTTEMTRATSLVEHQVVHEVALQTNRFRRKDVTHYP